MGLKKRSNPANDCILMIRNFFFYVVCSSTDEQADNLPHNTGKSPKKLQLSRGDRKYNKSSFIDQSSRRQHFVKKINNTCETQTKTKQSLRLKVRSCQSKANLCRDTHTKTRSPFTNLNISNASELG